MTFILFKAGISPLENFKKDEREELERYLKKHHVMEMFEVTFFSFV